MAHINLFYLSPNTTGGWVTFTSSLIEAFSWVHVETKLWKIGNNTEYIERSFGYDKKYRNLSEGDAYDICVNEPCLIVAAAKKLRAQAGVMVDLGAKLVIHDPTELKKFPFISDAQDGIVVIRKSGLDILPSARYIPHPYVRKYTYPQQFEPKDILCVSTSRIDFDKNTTILLDANRLLEEENKIQIHGFENRMYTKIKVVPNYPEWVQSKAAYPRERDAATNILKSAIFMADMSIIDRDGGGTQYTFLEAWDAGAIPIIHTDWIRPFDEMQPGVNCFTASNGKELVDILDNYVSHGIDRERNLKMQMAMHDQLAFHSPVGIGKQYLDFMGV